MKICVVGGGNLGHYIIAKLGANNEIAVLTRTPEEWGSEIVCIDENKKEYCARDVKATSNPKVALSDAEFIFITWPTNILAEKIKDIEPYIDEDQWVCFCPGYGGKEFICKELKNRNVHLIGTQRVFSSTKIIEKGHRVECIDNRPNIIMSSVSDGDLFKGKQYLENFFEKECIALDGYLNISLTPSNPVLHTSRIYSLFKNYKPGLTYDEHFAFYSNWSNYASDILISYDEEVQSICRNLGITGVKSLKEHYEIDKMDGFTDSERMTAKIRTLKFLKDKAPMVKSGSGYIPDFSSRYFREDFLYGLDILKEIASIIGTEKSTMQEIWDWFSVLTGMESKSVIKQAGVTSKQLLVDYYK